MVGEILNPAVVFDLDGTLIDSLPDVTAALNRLLAEEGRRAVTPDEARNWIGEGARPLIERGFAATGAAAPGDALPGLIERFVAHYRTAPAAETIVFPGVERALAALAARGVPMGVCTNKPHEMSRLVLAALGLDGYFASVIGGDALPVKKPDPGHLHAVLDEMGCSREGAVYVGDSPTDVAAGRNAGMRVIVVSWGYSRVPPAELGADALIDGFDELADALARVAAAEAGR